MPSQATSPLSVASAIVACTEEAALSTTFVKINPIAGSNAVALALSATRSVQNLLKNCAHIWPRHLMYAMAAARSTFAPSKNDTTCTAAPKTHTT